MPVAVPVAVKAARSTIWARKVEKKVIAGKVTAGDVQDFSQIVFNFLGTTPEIDVVEEFAAI